MIHIEILKSSDPLAVGIYEYEFDKISIGKSKKNDLIFSEPELQMRFLELKFIEKQLIVQGLDKSSFYHVNGKKISGSLKVRNGDIISFGTNELKIINSLPTNKSFDFEVEYDQFQKNSPELKFCLEFIEDVLIKIEKGTNV